LEKSGSRFEVVGARSCRCQKLWVPEAVGARRVTKRKSHSHDPQTFGAAVQNLVTRASCPQGLLHSCFTVLYLFVCLFVCLCACVRGARARAQENVRFYFNLAVLTKTQVFRYIAP
jgi:hypothetical protein